MPSWGPYSETEAGRHGGGGDSVAVGTEMEDALQALKGAGDGVGGEVREAAWT